MLPQSYKISHGLCLNKPLQILLIGNQRDQVTLFRYINWDDEVSHLVIGRKVLDNMKYIMRSVKRSYGAIVIWVEDNWDMKRMNSLYTMVSDGSNPKRDKRFDSLTLSLVIRDLYTRGGYTIGVLNEETEQA